MKAWRIICCLLLAASLHAQEDTLAKEQARYCMIRLQDGGSYQGVLSRQDDSLLVLEAEDGVQVHIPKHKVARIEFAKTAGDAGDHEKRTIGRRYYVLSSNALPFRPRETYGSASYLVFFHVNYAFSEHFSLGLSSTLIGAPVALQAKGRYEVGPRTHLGVELAAMSTLYLSPRTYASGGSVKLSFGTDKRNYTFFGGYGDLQYWTLSTNSGPFYQPGYYRRVFSAFAGMAAALPMSRKLNFTTEAFAFPHLELYTGAVALRTVGRKHTSFVFGIQLIGDLSTSVNRAFAFPYGGLSISF